MLRNALVAVSLFVAALAGLVYGVYAGRHDAFPSAQVIAVRNLVRSVIAPQANWWRDVNMDTSAAERAPCPSDAITIVTGGQSNAANHLSDPIDARPDIRAFMLYRGNCYRLADPLLGASGRMGSAWTALGHRIAMETGRSVVMINAAVTSTTYENWLSQESGYLRALTDRVAEARQLGLAPQLILWHQGESDAHRAATREAYAKPLSALVQRLLAMPGLASNAKLLLYRVSVCSGDRGASNAALIAAQTEIAGNDPRVIAGPDTDRLDARERYDGCHLNARGRDVVVARTMEALQPILAAAQEAIGHAGSAATNSGGVPPPRIQP